MHLLRMHLLRINITLCPRYMGAYYQLFVSGAALNQMSHSVDP